MNMLRTTLVSIVLLLAVSSTLVAGEVATAESATGNTFALVGAHIRGHGVATLIVKDGRIAEITAEEPSESLRVVDVTDRFIGPAFIDSHVHLAYAFSALELARGGIAAAVDLAAPVSFLTTDFAPLRVVLAGPMVTAITGYPTKSWGSDGYGLEIRGVAAATTAVDQLYATGARVIKMPIGDATGEGALTMAKNPSILSDAELKAVADHAHSLGMQVAAHAITDIAAQRAAAAGVDVLAHTPTERLSDATIAAWAERAVISTLAAFPKLSEPAENIRRLREAGATVLYGTDMGYTTFPGINPLELQLLANAGLDNAEIIAAGTTAPAKFWGFGPDYGVLAVGRSANFLVLDGNPEHNRSTLARPLAVYLDGRRIEAAVP